MLETSLKIWRKKELNKGARKFIRFYDNRFKYENNEIVIDDIVWDDELIEMIEFIKISGIEKFYISDSSTALKNVLYNFITNGFTITGAKTIKSRYYKHEEFNDKTNVLEISVNFIQCGPCYC